MKEIPFIKMHGAGNDFVFVDRRAVGRADLRQVARRLLDRHFGIGADQLIVYEKAQREKPPSVRFFNGDGSEAEMCGNGVRAVANHLREREGYRRDFLIQTKSRPIGIGLKGNDIQVDMGEPLLEGRMIPVAASGEIVERRLKIGKTTVRIHAVSMGNPHCVIFVTDVQRAPVLTLGPEIEHHPFFPRRVNVEFVQVVNRNLVRARVWERGAGETLACGTGACAIGVAAARANKTSRNVNVALPGGTLRVRWGQNNRVYLSGPAVTTFEGRFLWK